MPSLRAVFTSCMLIALVAGLGGCRTNLLPEYMPEKVQSAYVVTFADEHAVIDIDSNDDIVSGVAAIKVTLDMAERFERVLRAETLATAFATTFEEHLQPSFSTVIVGDKDAPHDVAIEMTIDRYGLRAASMSDPLTFFMEVDARMIYVPENKLIWEFGTRIDEPLSEVHVSGFGLGSLIGTGVNLSAISKLEDAQIVAIFDAIARDAAAHVVEQMREDAVR